MSLNFNKTNITMGRINTRVVCTTPSFAIALSRWDKVRHRTKVKKDHRSRKYGFQGTTATIDYFREEKTMIHDITI